ncbi:MAG: Rrf2 family transcriptional regulator [bacterium]
MFAYGKTAADAISVMSYLATLSEKQLADTEEIAKSRGISRAVVSKLLNRLTKNGLTQGIAGQRGGYRLGRTASSITLEEIISPFETSKTESPCPFGRNWCGKNNPCPIHDSIEKIAELNRQFLRGTLLSEFSRPTLSCATKA